VVSKLITGIGTDVTRKGRLVFKTVLVEKIVGEDCLEDICVCGQAKLNGLIKCIFLKSGVKWMHVARSRLNRQALLNAVMNSRSS